MTDAFKDLKALNRTYRDMVENTKNWPSIKDAKPPTKTNVKYDKHMKQYAPTVKESLNATCLFTEEELDAILEKMSAFDMVKQGLKDKGALIDSSKVKSKGMFDRSPAEQARRSKNWSDNQKGKDPYKSRPGESD